VFFYAGGDFGTIAGDRISAYKSGCLHRWKFNGRITGDFFPPFRMPLQANGQGNLPREYQFLLWFFPQGVRTSAALLFSEAGWQFIFIYQFGENLAFLFLNIKGVLQAYYSQHYRLRKGVEK